MNNQKTITADNGRPTTHIRFSGHARERLRTYDLNERELREALGHNIVDAAATITCPRAAADNSDILSVAPRPGSPVWIGTGYSRHSRRGHNPGRPILLVRLRSGRQVHVICVPYRSKLEIVTLWDPKTPETSPLWTRHCQMPTRAGAQSLPFSRWFLGDPLDPRSSRLRSCNNY